MGTIEPNLFLGGVAIGITAYALSQKETKTLVMDILFGTQSRNSTNLCNSSHAEKKLCLTCEEGELLTTISLEDADWIKRDGKVTAVPDVQFTPLSDVTDCKDSTVEITHQVDDLYPENTNRKVLYWAAEPKSLEQKIQDIRNNPGGSPVIPDAKTAYGEFGTNIGVAEIDEKGILKVRLVPPQPYMEPSDESRRIWPPHFHYVRAFDDATWSSEVHTVAAFPAKRENPVWYNYKCLMKQPRGEQLCTFIPFEDMRNYLEMEEVFFIGLLGSDVKLTGAMDKHRFIKLTVNENTGKLDDHEPHKLRHKMEQMCNTICINQNPYVICYNSKKANAAIIEAVSQVVLHMVYECGCVNVYVVCDFGSKTFPPT